MIGSPCDVGTSSAGTLNVTYTPQTNGTDTVSIVCGQSNPVYALNVGIDRGVGFEECGGPFGQNCTFLFGDGTATSQPGNISCFNNAGTCTDAFQNGSVVTLTATIGANTIFDGWSGCDSISGLTCTVTMNAVRNVFAHFSYSG
jgi:hypothetical protein